MTRVLVVDDDKDVLRVLEQLIESFGFETATFDHAADALDELRKRGADVVVTDIVMPSLDGFELLRSVRDEGLSTKVIALSGGSGVMSATQLLKVAKDLGAHALLRKPVSREQLQACLEESLRAA